MRRLHLVLVLLLLVGAAAIWLEGESSRQTRPVPEQDAGVPEAPPGTTPRPQPTTGTLLVRLRTADGRPVPADARAGYLRFGSPRLRAPAKDGTFPFSDAPLGRLDVTAEAPGWIADSVPVTVLPGVPAEVVVTLTAPGKPN